MAKVGIYRGGTIDPEGTTAAKFKPVDNGPGALAVGLQVAGKALGEYVEKEDRIQSLYDEAAAKELDNSFTTAARERLHTGDGAYFTLKGKDAVVSRKDTEAWLNKTRDEHLAQAKTPRQKAMLESVLRRRVDGALLDISQYEDKEAGVYEGQQSLARIDGATQDAILNWNDPVQRQAYIGTIEQEILGRAAREGWDSEYAQGEVEKARGQVYGAIVRKLALSDSLAAKGFLDQHRGEIDWKEQQQLDSALKEPLERQWSAGQVDALMGLEPEAVPEGEIGGTVSTGQMFDAIVAIEGGTDRRGNFLTSPKGAVGPAQVMPGTAPEAAKLAGLAYDERKYRTDAAYNLALGNAYFQKQLNDFGDPIMAAAAYNAGPGRVRQAIAKGGNDWVSHLPAETKKYVANFQRRSGAARQEPAQHDLNDLYARADKQAARLGWAFEQTEAVKGEIDRRVARDERLLARQEAKAFDEVTRTILGLGDKFTSVTQLGPAFSQMSPQQQLTVQNTAAANAKPKPVETDLATFWALRNMEATNPRAFVQLDPFKYTDKLSREDIKSIITRQAEVLGDDGKLNPKFVERSKLFSVSKDAMQAAGIETGDDKEARKPENVKTRLRFLDGMQSFADQWARENPGKAVDDATIRRWAGSLLTRNGPDGEPLFQMNVNEVAARMSSNDRDRAIAALRRANLPVTEANVTRIYMRAVRDNGYGR